VASGAFFGTENNLRFARGGRGQRRARSAQPAARQDAIQELPHEAIAFLLASGYCEVDRMMEMAWQLFGSAPPGWSRGMGYLGDTRVPAVPAPMDFSAWFDVYLQGTWYTMDARHNVPRVGRVLMARGRDAADVALLTSVGTSRLERSNVWCDEVGPEALSVG
jgi:transglutaminase-like putative cysteine protease